MKPNLYKHAGRWVCGGWIPYECEIGIKYVEYFGQSMLAAYDNYMANLPPLK